MTESLSSADYWVGPSAGSAGSAGSTTFPPLTPFTCKMREVRFRYERVASTERKLEQVFWLSCVNKVRSQDSIRAHVHWFPAGGVNAAIVEPIGIPSPEDELDELLALAVTLLV